MRKRIPIANDELLRRATLLPKFTLADINKFAKDVERGLIKIDHNEMYAPDPRRDNYGLKVAFRPNGKWSFKVEYRVKGEPGRRPYITIGGPEMSIERAREIARIVTEIGKRPGMTIERARAIIQVALDQEETVDG